MKEQDGEYKRQKKTEGEKQKGREIEKESKQIVSYAGVVCGGLTHPLTNTLRVMDPQTKKIQLFPSCSRAPVVRQRQKQGGESEMQGVVFKRNREREAKGEDRRREKQ